MHDDWFAEPKKTETKHDKYTRRLKAWGWLYHDGTPMWEVPMMTRLHDTVLTHYATEIKAALNEPIFPLFGRYGEQWVWNPEAPVD